MDVELYVYDLSKVGFSVQVVFGITSLILVYVGSG